MIIKVGWLPKNILGITIFPFIFCNRNLDIDDILINHERIHIRQQLELLVIPFYIMYGLEYIYNIFKFGNNYTAYKNISFEKEAFDNETNMNFLKKRPVWNFRKYI